MSLNHSPAVVTNGLVMYYDMGNTQKSWKGAPATNLVTNPTYEANPNATGNEFVQWGDLAPIFNTYGTTGVVYSLSFDLKSKIAGPVTTYMQNGSATKYAFVYQSINATTEYQRFTINGLSASIQNGAETLAMLAFYGVYGTGRIASIKNVQVEINPFATPFINGTRANTQSLLDLTNNNTLTATSLTYAANNTFSFNGSSNWIESPSSTLFDTQAVTMESWVKPAALSQNGFLFEKGLVNSQYSNFFQGVNFIFRTYAISNTDLTFVVATYITLNQWNHIVCTYGSGVKTIYVNGIQVAQATGITGTLNTNQGNQYIGKYGSLSGTPYPFSGSIGVSKVYNRSLSAAEVSQNFNALRGRYGI
jgi:hypothetical protein